MRRFPRRATALPAALLFVAGGLAAQPQELTEYQVRFGDMQRVPDGAAIVPRAPEMKEPSASWKKTEWRAENGGNKTVPRGRAWSSDQSRAARGGAGAGFTMDLAFTSVELQEVPGITGGSYGTPPDTMGAVGPTEYFTTLNSAYRVHDKTTGAIVAGLTVEDSDFWVAAVDPSNNGGGDPRVRFDRINDQWIVIAFTTGNVNRILIAISDGPTLDTDTTWTQWFISPGNTNGGSTLGCFADYPMLGVDVNAIYLGANMFGCQGGTNTAAFVVPFNGLPGGGGDASAATTAFPNLLGSVPIWTPMPVDNTDPLATEGYIIGHESTSDTNLKLGKISNPAGAPGAPTLTWHDVTVSDKNDGYGDGVPYAGNPTPAGSGSDWGLDALGFRAIGGAIVDGGRLWTAMTSSVEGPSGALRLFPLTGDRHSVVFFEIDVATNTLVQDGNVYDQSTARGANPFHTWMGSVSVNGPGHAVVGATVADADSLAPSTAWAARHVDDPLGDFSEPSIYVTGTNTGDARHSFEGSPRPTRWGDYAQVTVDPCDNMTFYTIAQYQAANALATGGNWATAVARILSPPPSVDSPTLGPVPGNSPSEVVTVAGGDFYQTPSTGMPSCRTELEITTSDPGLTVNDVTFNSASEIEIDFATNAAVNGDVTVTVTNPDGQSTDFTLQVNGTDIFADDFEDGNTGAWSLSVP